MAVARTGYDAATKRSVRDEHTKNTSIFMYLGGTNELLPAPHRYPVSDRPSPPTTPSAITQGIFLALF
jgi:hypothetical protein